MRQPKATLLMRCDECGKDIAEIDANTTHLVSVVSQLKKEHAVKEHSWSER
jgi:hypothetical protein